MTATRAPKQGAMDTTVIGSWQIVVYDRVGNVTDLTVFRGAPTQLNNFSTSDPFGSKQLNMTFPQVTPFDSPGIGDLHWLAKGCLIAVRWIGPLPNEYQYGQTRIVSGIGGPVMPTWDQGFCWEGQIITPTFDGVAGMTLVCTGAAYQLDFYQAKPEYPARPLPYEHAIARQFRGKPHLRMKPLRIAWPLDWGNQYTSPPKGTPSYLIPSGVKKGDNWTGLLTRETGKWEPTLTSYIQTLLASMYIANGRWTLDIWGGRVPLLTVRSILSLPTQNSVYVDPLAPGNQLNLTVDWSQSLDVIYAQGTDLNGVAFTGMEISSDGKQTYYQPAAARRQAWPLDSNPWLDTSCMPIETMLQLQSGIDEASGASVARSQLRNFADPGVVGQITLGSDVRVNGQQVSRYLVRAGMNLVVPGLFGRSEGMVLHISDTSADFDAGTNTLTVDSKFRDALTVAQARIAGRDALAVPRMLVAGQYQPPVPDQVVPWNYAKGSGYIPSWKGRSALPLFDGMPNLLPFPWTPWTTTRPPKSHEWRHCYIGPITPAHVDTDKMWAYKGSGPADGASKPVKGQFAIPIKAAEAATIRLLQIAAYDEDGNVAKVPFHVSFYQNDGTTIESMPTINNKEKSGPDAGEGTLYVVGGIGVYAEGDHYPFGSDGWEQYNPDGTLPNPQLPAPVNSDGLLRAYGTYFQMAGFYPGDDPGPTNPETGAGPNRVARLAAATGLLVDEAQWSISTPTNQWNPYSKKSVSGESFPYAGYIFAMIYCDVPPTNGTDIYFLGRMFQVEPGTGL